MTLPPSARTFHVLNLPSATYLKHWLRLLLAAVLVLTLGVASVVSLGPVPRLGPLLDPIRGIWSVAGQATQPTDQAVVIPSLGASVRVVTDSRGVPHVFAESENDAYRVMGYLHARERLFEMDLSARAGSGTLTGLLGQRALGSDAYIRSFGLAWGAERKIARLDTTSAGFAALLAYTEGVNAFLDAMGPTDLPFEYHLLGTRPSRWSPTRTAYLLARMGMTLALGDPALSRLAVQGLVGGEAAEALVPLDNPIQEPIQPADRRGPRYAFRSLPPPGDPDPPSARFAMAFRDITRRNGPPDGDALGSNNWAVAPGRALNGFALLSGDPHLGLTLPSIWYEIHLVVPGRLDVAGVSLPGAPGVVIGFNRDIAWTFTNTQGDVLDLYAETVDDSLTPRRYLLDEEWVRLQERVETYRDPRGKVLDVDTVRFTHRGPLQRREGMWVSVRWTVNEPSFETDLFLRGSRARSVDEWLEVMEGYVAPTQNGLVADRIGTIAIRSSGNYPIRPDDGRGDVIRDGSTRASDWLGNLPVERYPFSRDPAQGFLASANQQPVDPVDNSAYLGADWIAPWRALRINRLLRADAQMTPEVMRRYQTDPGSARADAFVPYFLEAARVAITRGTGDSVLTRAADLLREWDRTYPPGDQRAILFEYAMDELTRRTWDELIDPTDGRRVHTPDGSILLELMQDSGSVWWDDMRSPAKESRDEILNQSLRHGLEVAMERHGEPEAGGWRWSGIRNANIRHLLGLEGLSALRLPVAGGPSTISPLGVSGTAGASWRMVVELGDTVRAWATYPGGQSGNPASRWFDDRIPQWVAGELDRVLVPGSADELPASQVVSRITFRPGGAS